MPGRRAEDGGADVERPEGGSARSGGWKDLALAILVTALFTVATQALAFGKDTARREEVQGLQAAVTELSKQVNQLSTTVAVLSDRVGARTEAQQPQATGKK